MLNVRLAGEHLYGKLLSTWLSLVMSLMMSFYAVLFPRDVFDEICDLMESVYLLFYNWTQRDQNRHQETTNATANNKRSWNQQSRTGCIYLSGNNFPRIKLIRGKLFPDRNSCSQGGIYSL